jgi:hypothetical protein
MYIKYATVYGWWKEGIDSLEKAIEAFDKWEKTVDKYNIKLLFWAGAYGASEPIMMVAKFKDIKDWEKALNERAFRENPLDRTRTIFGLDYTS